jgi:hypothetical protein
MLEQHYSVQDGNDARLAFLFTNMPNAAPCGNEPKRRDPTRLPRPRRLCASAQPFRQYPALLGCRSRLTRSRTHFNRCGSPSSQRGGECRQAACRRRQQRRCLEACDWMIAIRCMLGVLLGPWVIVACSNWRPHGASGCRHVWHVVPQGLVMHRDQPDVTFQRQEGESSGLRDTVPVA